MLLSKSVFHFSSDRIMLWPTRNTTLRLAKPAISLIARPSEQIQHHMLLASYATVFNGGGGDGEEQSLPFPDLPPVEEDRSKEEERSQKPPPMPEPDNPMPDDLPDNLPDKEARTSN